MTFSNEWNEIYNKNEQMSSWPWSDLISLVHRHCARLISNNGNVLELGCGAGANIPYFKALSVNYYGLDGSKEIINHLKNQHPELEAQLECADFTSSQPFEKKFDLIFDRAALTHNNNKSIKQALALAGNSLKDQGIYIGIDYFSVRHSDYKNGISVDDEYTRTGYTSGQFKGCGKVHYFDKAHINNLFEKFEIIYLTEKITREYVPENSHQFASWNLVAIKNEQ